jgi:thiol-disulfide isomerase/thioredoxin
MFFLLGYTKPAALHATRQIYIVLPEITRCGNVRNSWHDVCFIIKVFIFDICSLTNTLQYMKKIAAALCLVIGFSAMAQNNQTMPEIILKDVNGKVKNVNEYSKSGKITIISFWATWCTPCKKELSNLRIIR